MKTFYFLICLIFMGTFLHAQQFSTQFYFTDTLGNQDTVTVGFDPDGTLGVDSIFGEVDTKGISFGEEFEVRVGQIDHEDLGCFPNDGPLTGTNIDSDQSGLVIRMGKEDYNGISCENGMLTYQFFGKTTFFIKNKDLPIKINWDIQVFSNICLSRSLFTDWHPGGWFDFVACGNSFIKEISDITELWVNEPTNIQIVDRSGDTLSMIHLSLLDGIVRVSVVATGVESEYKASAAPIRHREAEAEAVIEDDDEFEIEDEFELEDEFEAEDNRYAPAPAVANATPRPVAAEPAYVAPKPYPPKVAPQQPQPQQYQAPPAPAPQPEPRVVVKKPFGFFGLKKQKPVAARPVRQQAPQPSGDLFGDNMDEELEIPSFLRRQNR